MMKRFFLFVSLLMVTMVTVARHHVPVILVAGRGGLCEKAFSGGNGTGEVPDVTCGLWHICPEQQARFAHCG